MRLAEDAEVGGGGRAAARGGHDVVELEPVDGDFTVTSTLPEAAAWERFLATLARHDRARVTVAGTARCASGVGGRHEGTYVALRSGGR